MSAPQQDNSSGSLQSQSNQTIGQSVTAYLASVPQEDRNARAQDLNAFVRWFGAQRAVGSITPLDLERYQEQMEGESRIDSTSRLQSLRDFLTKAKREGWTEKNLAVEVKLRRRGSAQARVRKTGNSRQGSDQHQIRMSRAGYEKLSKELEHLETNVRAQIAQDLKQAAADKDFKENSPYDAAKQHQGQVEARIRELKGILETGEVVDHVDQRKTDLIDLGSKVTLRDLEEDEEIVYELVGPGEIDPRRGKISIQSPVGRALSGKSVGDEVEVEVPGGRVRMRVERVGH